MTEPDPETDDQEIAPTLNELADVGDFYGESGVYGPFPPFKHGKKVKEIADEVLAILLSRGYELYEGRLDTLRNTVERNGHLSARRLGVSFPYSLRYVFPERLAEELIKASGLPRPDPSKLKAVYGVPLNAWGEFTSRVPEPKPSLQDLIGPADAFPLDWDLPMHDCTILDIGLRDNGETLALLVEVPLGSEPARRWRIDLT